MLAVVALTAILGLMAIGPAVAGPSSRPVVLHGKVVAVADGDTVTVLVDRRQVRIRLHSVDCPEKKQPFGQKAKQFTSRLVFGKPVTVKVATTDKYGRTVGEVMFGDRSLNEELIKAGLAWWYRKYAPRAKMLAFFEEEARKARRGLWADPNPTAPWDFRHRAKPLRGNVRSRVFHAPGCAHYRCKSCTAIFKTVEAALRAGYRAHAACVSSPGKSR